MPTLAAQSVVHAATAPAAGAAPGVMHVISPYMGVFMVAFIAALVVTPIMRTLAARNGIVDWPDLKRKNHCEPVAYLGGLAIFCGWLAAVMVGYFTSPDNGGLLQYVSFPLSVVIGAGAITLTGLFDDVYGISPRVKVSGQLFAAAALASQDVGFQLVHQATAVLGLHLPFGVVYALGAAVIAIFVLGGCNSMNLLDGLDGLACGVAVIASLGFLIIAAIVASRNGEVAQAAQTASHLIDDPVRLAMCLAILGALLGFLPYNFNPATIFMGDAGSLLIGYLCVATILMFAGGGDSSALLLVTACLIVFALPITDTSLAIFRRKMRGQGILTPDNEHIHHLLRRSGLSVRQSVAVMYAIAAVFAALGVSMVALEWRWRYVLAVFVVLYSFIIVTAYKYGRRGAPAPAAAPKPVGDAEGSAKDQEELGVKKQKATSHSVS